MESCQNFNLILSRANLNYRISTSGPVPLIRLKECDVRSFCGQHQMKFIFKKSWLLTRSTSFQWSKTRSWKFKIQNHKILSSRVKGLLKIKHLMRIFNLMEFLFLKIELPVTSILQYLKTFNIWIYLCLYALGSIPEHTGKDRFKYPLSREKRIIKNRHLMSCYPSKLW